MHPVDDYLRRYDRRPFDLALESTEQLAARYKTNLIDGALQTTVAALMVLESASGSGAKRSLLRIRNYIDQQIKAIDLHESSASQKGKARV